MAGLVASIFGKTVQELQQERIAKRKQAMAQAMRSAQQQGGNTGAAAIGFRLGGMLADKMFDDPRMEKARQAEEQQAALNAQLSELPRTDPRRFYLISDAYNKVGDTKTAADYLRLGQQVEFRQQEFKQQQAEKNAARAAELEKRKTLSEAYPNNQQAQKMALAGFTVDQIEKIIGAKKQKAFIAEPTKEDIEQVSSILSMNEINFGEETQPVVISKLAEELSKLKNDYKKEYEEGNLEKPWVGDTEAISGLLKDFQQQGFIINDPSLIGGGWKFNPMGQSQQQNQQDQTVQKTPTAVQKTFPEGLPTNNNNNTSNQTEASMGTLGDIIGIPTGEELKGLYDNITDRINWQDYLNE